MCANAHGALRLDLPLAGAWSVRIDALVSDFEKAVFETEIVLR